MDRSRHAITPSPPSPLKGEGEEVRIPSPLEGEGQGGGCDRP